MRKLVSLISLYSFLICAFTGSVLYIVPMSRVARAIKWTLLGFGRADYVKFHTIFSIVVLLALLVHIYYNIAAIQAYMKVKFEGISFLKSESLVALIIIVLIFIGTNYNVTPFSQIMKWGTEAKTSWGKNVDFIPGQNGGQR